MFLHVDINSYFATILQQENPFLRGKPIGVVKSKGRTCIIAASKEAKKFGVKTGCVLYEAKKLCPKIITVPAEFNIYSDTTKRLKKIFENITPDAEIFSLDEAFIPYDSCKLMYNSPLLLGEKIQQDIKKELGDVVTCNVGIGPNRLLAKIASEISAKGSIFEINEENKVGVLKTVEFKDVCGIGSRLEERLAELGVKNPYDINKLSREVLKEKFGEFFGTEIARIGNGEGSYILDETNKQNASAGSPARPAGGFASAQDDEMKSVGRTITGYKLCDSETDIKRIVYNLMDEVTYKVRKMGLAGRYVSIFLHGEEKTWHAHRTLKHYVRHTNEMFDILYNQLYKKFRRNFKVIRFGVSLEMLTRIENVQPTLFLDWYKNEKLYNACDKISEKFGLFTIHSAILNKKEIIKPEVTGYLGDKKYQFMEK